MHQPIRSLDGTRSGTCVKTHTRPIGRRVNGRRHQPPRPHSRAGCWGLSITGFRLPDQWSGIIFGACSARSNSAPHPRRPSISCATEKACHRQDRFSRGDREGEPQRQHSIALFAAYPSALTSTKRPKSSLKVRATGQQFETLIQPDQMTPRHADRIDANTITKIDRTPTNRRLIL